MKNKKIDKIAIANRGEVAVRIIRACQELGIKTLLLHSEVDVQSRAYRMADDHVCIGPAPTAESYLSIEKNIQGALQGGAQAIHPGFGFLSENAAFSDACEKAGMIFIGPSGKSIRTLGDKMQCKTIAQKLGIPMVPGYQGTDQKIETLMAEAQKIGFPVIVKAAAGGGGRGMKVIRQASESRDLIESAQREAKVAFGSPVVFLEKYLDRAKHIEFQIFAEADGQVRHLFERECSVQRRHQKIIEEAPSPSLTESLRKEMSEAAVHLVQRVGYRGAGTVEFLLQGNDFYFMEMNTRLQVEHPVTEMVLNIDLVKGQILVAQGQASGFKDHDLKPKGHSIECRLYAENPFQGGVPSTGLLGMIHWPESYGRRFEFGFEEGDEITSFYDPMIAKLIVWDESRDRAIQKMLRVLEDSIIFGVHTNIPLLEKIISHKEFKEGIMTTRFFETYFSEPLELEELSEETQAFVTEVRKKARDPMLKVEGGLGVSPWQSYWRGI